MERVIRPASPRRERDDSGVADLRLCGGTLVVEQPDQVLLDYLDVRNGYAYPAYDNLATNGTPALVDGDLLAPALIGVHMDAGRFGLLREMLPALEAVADLPDVPLHEADEDHILCVAGLFGILDEPRYAGRGVRGTVVSKVLHRKRPDLVPLYDSRIFEAYTAPGVLPRSTDRAWATSSSTCAGRCATTCRPSPRRSTRSRRSPPRRAARSPGCGSWTSSSGAPPTSGTERAPAPGGGAGPAPAVRLQHGERTGRGAGVTSSPDARCDPDGERAALLDADPALSTAPPGLELRQRTALDATYDAVKTYDCNEQVLLVDLAPVDDPAAALRALQRHLEDGGWTVTAVDEQVLALTATRELAPSLSSTLRANVDAAQGVLRVAAALPPAVVDAG